MAKPSVNCKRIRGSASRCIHGRSSVRVRSRWLDAPQARQRAAQCKAATQDAPAPPADAPAGAIGDQMLAVDASGARYGPEGKVEKVAVERIRNFSIIAHIDHGKSTLADQLLIKTGTVDERDMMKQFLDGMDLERERGITIKLNTARMRHVGADGEVYCLNLIDTPGHVDFSYEVSRSLQACEGALLVVDASQGIEAQTLANVWLAIENDLEIIPVINKIDLPGADPEKVKREISEVIGIDASDALLCSAKTGEGIDAILTAIVDHVPPPQDNRDKPLRALIFDSFFDQYLGVVCQFRVMDGCITKRDTVQFMNTGKTAGVTDLWARSPARIDVDCLYAGEVGCVAGAIKAVQDARVGDTITLKKCAAGLAPLPGYAEAKPQVFCGLFPVDADQFNDLRDALGKLQLNDAALSFEPEASSAMGFGFRCGFLGMLHMDIVQERLEREHNLDLIMTAPTVIYQCRRTNGVVEEVSNPSALPDVAVRESISEPFVKMEVITPTEYNGQLMELCQQRRGEFLNMQYLTPERVTLSYEMPLAEVVTDFFDEMKSKSKGYASMEYQFIEHRVNDLVLMDIKINGEIAEPLATICHRDQAYGLGKALCNRLKELIPRQQFKVPIQAAIGNKAIASASLAAMRKDVLAKCYGGDISRKKKLLSKQAEGKKRMKSIGRVDVPQEAFMAVLSAKADK